MSRKLLKISYLGENYCGWQVQPNGVSVQQTLQNAMEELFGERPNVCGCSRTDGPTNDKLIGRPVKNIHDTGEKDEGGEM